MSDPIRIPIRIPVSDGSAAVTPEIARQIVALGMGSMPLTVGPDGTARPLSAVQPADDLVPGAEYDAMVDRMSAEIDSLRAELASRPSLDVAIGLAYCAAEDDLRGELGEARAEAEKLAGLLEQARPLVEEVTIRMPKWVSRERGPQDPLGAHGTLERIDAALAARAKGEM
jgi:hypothetical protein